jgi:hypothetical protein
MKTHSSPRTLHRPEGLTVVELIEEWRVVDALGHRQGRGGGDGT